MAIDTNHITKLGELKSLIDQLWTKIKSTFSAIGHTHTKSDVTDFPTNVSAFTNDAGYLTESTAEKELFWCTYGETTYLEINSAIQSGKVPSINYNGNVFTGCRLYIPGGQSEAKAYYEFTSVIEQFLVQIKVDDHSEWSNDSFQTVKNDGTNATGTWGVDISGNAASADKATFGIHWLTGNITYDLTKLPKFPDGTLFLNSSATTYGFRIKNDTSSSVTLYRFNRSTGGTATQTIAAGATSDLVVTKKCGGIIALGRNANNNPHITYEG